MQRHKPHARFPLELDDGMERKYENRNHKLLCPILDLMPVYLVMQQKPFNNNKINIIVRYQYVVCDVMLYAFQQSEYQTTLQPISSKQPNLWLKYTICTNTNLVCVIVPRIYYVLINYFCFKTKTLAVGLFSMWTQQYL